MQAVEKEFDGTAASARIKRIALATKGDIDRAVRGDLGDMSMSGWRRGKPLDIKGAYKVEGADVFMVPSAVGPMR